jgi:murein DD-endopeptidase MepM/ murein hydrolase activator NlpD
MVTDESATGVAGRRRHRVSPSRRNGASPGRHRSGLLLAALLSGGLAAGVLGVHATPGQAAEPTSVAAAQQALLSDGDEVEVAPQASITEAEAAERLRQVAASRATRQAAADAASQAAQPPAPECVLPVAGAQLTSTFSVRWGVMHWGIDLAAPMRTPEYAARDGVVLRAGASQGFGLAVYIKHENGDVTVYGHMDSITVKVGQFVQAGERIALLGMRGESTGPHLHFEVHKDSEYGGKIDPLPWLRACGVSI